MIAKHEGHAFARETGMVIVVPVYEVEQVLAPSGKEPGGFRTLPRRMERHNQLLTRVAEL